MHRACTHGTEDMGFLLSLTFHGDLDLVGPWDMTGKLGDREAAISEAWALPQFFTLGYLDLFGFIWAGKKIVWKLPRSLCAFFWDGVG